MKRKPSKNIILYFELILSILAISLLLFLITKFSFKSEDHESYVNESNKTYENVTTTIPFANENISIEVPPGIVRIGKGRIEIVS